MKDNKEAPLDGRKPGVHPIPEPDSKADSDTGAAGKLDEIVGAVLGNDHEVTAPGIAPDHEDKEERRD
ncbi:hypothetical protein R70723_07805 [Paenibacillus sp. FSL R7-0273]|uniref:hypothetical protein n=1 Tax=Paenibacillus sp. FSL R7-0273 TaxID=1536772 RepID=UPI0004F7AC95|nr:hypothetical protein [Paenibacillus sp. FSL R7-0273]AIQ45794.1 hypothetical protein R70723_07805 [Paenibacillus sp. FSL R7-0273]OMF95321.1 hypothetical protein BK144_07325 [Paenibacillus sp. FSL R7-0273]